MAKPGPISAKPLSVLLSDVFSDAYAKQGFAARELVTRWADIAGPEVAAHSEPLKIQWPRPIEGQPQEPATLVLRVEGPMALEIQHASDVILQRVNRFFGWSAVGRLALRQAPLSRRDRPKASRAPDPKAVAEVAEIPVLGGGRAIAGRAGPAWRLDQAKLSLPRAAGIEACHCHNCRFKLANTPLLWVHWACTRQSGSKPLIITRRAFTAALSLTGLSLLAGLSPLRLIADAMAQSASDVAKPVSLPDMALGPANASVTITEYASMTCPHCAAFNETVFPKIKSEYIDTGKIRYVFREFPLDIKAAAGSMLSRCIAKDDSGKYFAVTDMLFRQQNDWVMKNTTETLTRIGKQAGLSQQAVEDCLKDQALLDKIAADQKYAAEVLKVNSTPTFFVNGEKIKGETSFEEFDKRIKSLLKS